MPLLSETASAIKSRFGFQNHAVSESIPSAPGSPDLLQSVSRENLSSAQSLHSMAIVRSIGEQEDPLKPQTQNFEFNQDPSFWKDHNVQVIIRLRPLSSSEISVQGYNKCVRQESCQTITWTGHPESRFTFDLVADETVSQEKLFKVAGLSMVENCIGGYNSCMFAYGQTGSGKTHTMLGDIEGGTRRHSVNCGMIPRVFEYLFTRIQKEKEARKEEKLKFTCKCSFLEIYNEQILDLLDPSSNNLQIREDVKKGVYVENLKEIEVASARDVIEQLIQGAANRKVAATNMNHASSRSHSVFTCVIESKWESQGVTHHRFARLNLVDLAGSERQKSSGAEGERLKEATNINKSLSTLGLVIMNLVSISNGKSLHVPYRDSKLTFLLQDSLGGNSKTSIIANISPSLCCSLETLSTLKFAQRAKYIKNNAIVNEDASGDVIAMRMQIQQLKKELSRLRGLVNEGAENQNDTSVVSFLGSPGSFKWEGLHGSLSPLMSDKKMCQGKDYEAVLVGAFRRENDKDNALKALAAENQAAVKLAKQREDEIQGLKMRLRFREAAIKRLEAVASGKISVEAHSLKEKEEHLKEIEVLQTQVDRNQEVTRFAMENLRLKEEIRRLKSFNEEGEREMMNEQIMVLQNKLLEALEWKLMHESDSLIVQKANSDANREVHDDLTISSEEPRSPWHSFASENEFLRVQAIHNQAEIDTLHEQLDFCSEEREKLQRHVHYLSTKLEQERSLRVTEEGKRQIEITYLSTDASVGNFDDQEIKTMVDTIAAASRREAEAYEKAATLSRENDELRLKLKTFIEANDELHSQLKDLIEEKNSLIEMYARAASKSDTNLNKAESSKQNDTEHHGCSVELIELQKTEIKADVKNLEHQLLELHEENEKLMGLYERAMHERDEFKRMLSCSKLSKVERRGFDLPKTLEVDKEESFVPTIPEEEIFKLNVQGRETEPSDLAMVNLVDLNLIIMKLEIAQEKLSDSVNILTVFGSLEKAVVEFDKLSKEIEATLERLQDKQENFRSLEQLSSDMQERKDVIVKKFSALRYSLSSLCSSAAYFEQRNGRARKRVYASSSHLAQKKEELARLQVCKSELEVGLRRFHRSEAELKNNLTFLKSKLEEENRRQDYEKVLFAIDNIEKEDNSQRNWNLAGKATELLKSEEEKTQLQNEIKRSREKLSLIRMEFENSNKNLKWIEGEIKAVQMEIQKGSMSMEEMEVALEGVIQEKETLLEVREKGMTEIQMLIVEYQQHVFDSDLKEAEMQILEEEVQVELRRIEELRRRRASCSEKISKLLEDTSPFFLSEKMREKLQVVRVSILEAKAFLGDRSSNDISQ